MSEVLRIFDPNTQTLEDLKKIMDEWHSVSKSEIRKIEVTFDDFKPKIKPLLRGDIYRHTNHFIRSRDYDKFLAFEVGNRNALLVKYFGSVDKALSMGVTVYRREGFEYNIIVK